MRRLGLLLIGIALLASACGSAEVVAPKPETIEGTVPQATTTAPPAKGDPAAGKSVFASAGCGGCHTYKPAGTNATVGPNLDQLASYAQKANQPLDSFTLNAIKSPPAPYVPPGYPTNVMPTTFGQSLSATQLADLVAFLTQK